MNGWHVEGRALRAYVARELEPIERASVEVHMSRCQTCRADLAALIDGTLGAVSFAAVWDRVQTRVEDAPAVGVTQWLGRVGVAEIDSVVVRQIGRQCLQWTLASTLILVLAVFAAAFGGSESGQLGFVLLAPLLPPLGVAATYWLTPTSTAILEGTSPYSPARLLMWRTGYVLATAVPASVALGALIPGSAWLAVAWLLPGAACTAVVLVAATWTDPARPAAAIAGIWFVVVAAWFVGETPDAVFAPATQALSLIVALAAGVVFTRRLVEIRVRVV